MPRRDDLDDADDHVDDRRLAHPRRKTNPFLVAIIILLGGTLLVVTVCGGLIAFMMSRPEPARVNREVVVEEVGDSQRIYTRDEWKALVMGKIGRASCRERV